MGVSKTAERWLGDGQGTGTQALFLEDVNVSPSSPPCVLPPLTKASSLSLHLSSPLSPPPSLSVSLSLA